jgi:hypothetical protein
MKSLPANQAVDQPGPMSERREPVNDLRNGQVLLLVPLPRSRLRSKRPSAAKLRLNSRSMRRLMSAWSGDGLCGVDECCDALRGAASFPGDVHRGRCQIGDGTESHVRTAVEPCRGQRQDRDAGTSGDEFQLLFNGS